MNRGRGRPRTCEGKEYVYTTFRKRKDDFLDVIRVYSRYDAKTQNNRPFKTKKLGVVPVGYKDLDKEMILCGTPEMQAFTAKARMRRWPDKAPRETPRAINDGTESVDDQRDGAKTIFPLGHVVMVILFAAMAGYVSTYQVAEFWKTFRKIFEVIFPGFPREDISHDTVRRITQILGRSDNEKFISALTGPLIQEGKKRRQIALDGQAVRAARVHHPDYAPYIFNAFDVSNGMTLSQRLIGEKKNEISEAINLVRNLDLSGCIVTVDALNTQKEFSRELVFEKRCDYCFALKSNHKTTYGVVKALFELEPTELQRRGHQDLEKWKSQRAKTLDKAHGRIEERTIRILPACLLDEEQLKGWAGLDQGIIVEAVTESYDVKKTKTSRETRYFISSLRADSDEGLPEEVMEIIRNHWGIENKLHWVLDTTFLQDRTQCTNADFLVGRALIMKVANNWLSAFQRDESPTPEKQSSKQRWKIRCLDIRETWDRICRLL